MMHQLTSIMILENFQTMTLLLSHTFNQSHSAAYNSTMMHCIPIPDETSLHPLLILVTVNVVYSSMTLSLVLNLSSIIHHVCTCIPNWCMCVWGGGGQGNIG